MDATEKLYEAVKEYIEVHNGTVLVIGGVELIRDPLDRKYNYKLAIGVTGKLPVKAGDDDDMA